MWFQGRLGTVAGVMSAGYAGAIALIPPFILLLIQQFGWRGAYGVLGVLIWLIMLPLLLVLYRNRPEDVGQLLDGRSSAETVRLQAETKPEISFSLREAQHTRAYWILLAVSAAFR
ncbi:MAG: MFS transporter [Chloroflexi bacterium]|nr:MFS transporter [Chloroflexota bacterium]